MLNSIQLLRVAAALLVFGAHMPQWALPMQDPRSCGRDAVMCGAIGIDIFFCISGFLMYVTTANKNHGARTAVSFFVRRIFRIWPLYIVATVLYMSYWQVPVLNYLRPLLFLPIHQEVGFRDPPISAGWTLNFEMYFYVLAAAALMFPWKVKGAAVLVAVLGITSFFLGDKTYFMGSIIVEFAFGVVLGAVFLHKQTWLALQQFRVPMLIGSILVFLLAAHGTDWPKDPGLAVPRMEILVYTFEATLPRFIAWGLPALLLMTSVMLFESKIPKSAASLGDYTYSIYLLYLPIASWIEIYSKTLSSQTYAAVQNHGGFAALLVVALFASSFISYHIIERPFQWLGGLLAKSIERRPIKNAATPAC
ncbi:acyltransferase family protein [Achromobacter xylosoxidans]|uniref:Acyltransferase n=1 Tax=Alcaligenes xylosoxydans xylosoxydans TaxID=85698 RepID=A0A424WAY3_ALCXX|nr:acyltransferase [Achromobacter xylosoxidans]MBC9904862.1 acyltransferase [Achromobacter xylosoxidans]MBD0868779.1 acyltransferase [Achromobacter xylosoxidans]QNP87723.1 acyltransferase [Achromobacter xylosoxidans]RPJ90385.1 acyltransferase [Achromobacter xylosoxidans]